MHSADLNSLKETMHDNFMTLESSFRSQIKSVLENINHGKGMQFSATNALTDMIIDKFNTLLLTNQRQVSALEHSILSKVIQNSKILNSVLKIKNEESFQEIMQNRNISRTILFSLHGMREQHIFDNMILHILTAIGLVTTVTMGFFNFFCIRNASSATIDQAEKEEEANIEQEVDSEIDPSELNPVIAEEDLGAENIELSNMT